MSKVEEKHREAAAEALNKTGCQGVCHCHSKYIAQAIADAEERGRRQEERGRRQEERAQVVKAIRYWSQAMQLGVQRVYKGIANGIVRRRPPGGARTMTARTLCCNKPMMGLGGDPNRVVVSWNPYNGVIQCHACGAIYVDSKDPKDYDRWCDAGGGMEQDRAPRAVLWNGIPLVRAADDMYESAGGSFATPAFAAKCTPIEPLDPTSPQEWAIAPEVDSDGDETPVGWASWVVNDNGGHCGVLRRDVRQECRIAEYERVTICGVDLLHRTWLRDRAPAAAPTILESATNMVKSFAATDCYGATLCSPTSRCLPCRSRALLEEKGL